MNETTKPQGVKIKYPKAFRLIQLELAREAKHPAGDRGYGYRLVVPLDDNARIDADLAREYQDLCKVVRFRPNEDDQVGHLVRKGAGWAFHYDIRGEESDEVGYRLADERFVIGEYLSIREDDGMHTFKVRSVEHV